MPKYTYTPFTTPPYTNVGQLYWSNSYNTLVSSNGAQTSIWFGNIWLPVTSATNGKVTGTNMAVADAMKLLHQIYYSQDLTNIGQMVPLHKVQPFPLNTKAMITGEHSQISTGIQMLIPWLLVGTITFFTSTISV